jgi:hypothetical protein
MHKKAAKRAQEVAWATAHPERVRSAARAAYENSAEMRQRRNEYKRAWRKVNREKVREQKRRYVERHRNDPKSAYVRYQEKYRKRHREYYRVLENTHNQLRREARGVPACGKCGKPTGWTPMPGRGGRPWSKCMKCLFPCERRERRRIRREAAKRIAADPPCGLPPKPVKVRRPSSPATRGPGFERLCLTPDCETVVTHRKKKCTRCRQRDADIAAAKLEAHRGRGRRDDLERVA